MTVQHGSYRSIPAGQPKPKARTKPPRQHRDTAGDFHTALRKLRSALYADDESKVSTLERELDKIVTRWERENENAVT